MAGRKGSRKRKASNSGNHKRQRELNSDERVYASDVEVRHADGTVEVQPASGPSLDDFERRRAVGGDRTTGWERRSSMPATLPCDRCGMLVDKGSRGEWHRSRRVARHRRCPAS